MQEICTLRAMRRALETESRTLLTGHEGGNAGNSQGGSYGFTRQRSTLPGAYQVKLGQGIVVPGSGADSRRKFGDNDGWHAKPNATHCSPGDGSKTKSSFSAFAGTFTSSSVTEIWFRFSVSVVELSRIRRFCDVWCAAPKPANSVGGGTSGRWAVVGVSMKPLLTFVASWRICIARSMVKATRWSSISVEGVARRPRKHSSVKALKHHTHPHSITLDGHEPSHSALRVMGMNGEFNFRGPNPVKIRSCQYLNNIVEQDHRGVKFCLQALVGLKSFFNERRVIVGIELAHKIHKRQFAIPDRFGSSPTAVWCRVMAA